MEPTPNEPPAKAPQRLPFKNPPATLSAEPSASDLSKTEGRKLKYTKGLLEHQGLVLLTPESMPNRLAELKKKASSASNAPSENEETTDSKIVKALTNTNEEDAKSIETPTSKPAEEKIEPQKSAEELDQKKEDAKTSPKKKGFSLFKKSSKSVDSSNKETSEQSPDPVPAPAIPEVEPEKEKKDELHSKSKLPFKKKPEVSIPTAGNASTHSTEESKSAEALNKNTPAQLTTPQNTAAVGSSSAPKPSTLETTQTEQQVQRSHTVDRETPASKPVAKLPFKKQVLPPAPHLESTPTSSEPAIEAKPSHIPLKDVTEGSNDQNARRVQSTKVTQSQPAPVLHPAAGIHGSNTSLHSHSPATKTANPLSNMTPQLGSNSNLAGRPAPVSPRPIPPQEAPTLINHAPSLPQPSSDMIGRPVPAQAQQVPAAALPSPRPIQQQPIVHPQQARPMMHVNPQNSPSGPYPQRPAIPPQAVHVLHHPGGPVAHAIPANVQPGGPIVHAIPTNVQPGAPIVHAIPANVQPGGPIVHAVAPGQPFVGQPALGPRPMMMGQPRPMAPPGMAPVRPNPVPQPAPVTSQNAPVEEYSSKFCGQCGTKFSLSDKFCSECGSKRT